ncbi:MAG: 2-phosphosulfolactate phosphatase [Desulfatiglandales bacterium]
MYIKTTRLLEGARGSEGLVVIIDVFRAFTCLPLLYHLGAKGVILERDVERAKKLRDEFPHSLLVGEQNEVPIEGSEIGNSPYRILKKRESLKGKLVIHRSTAGVVGVHEALRNNTRVLMSGFINAKATADAVKEVASSEVTLVAMGERGVSPAPEDEACALYIHSLLEPGVLYDPLWHMEKILGSYSYKKFFDPRRPYLEPEDPIICLQRDLVPMALEAVREGDLVMAKPFPSDEDRPISNGFKGF